MCLPVTRSSRGVYLRERADAGCDGAPPRAPPSPANLYTLHRHFVRNQVNKVNPRKEFFRAPLQDIRAEIEKRGFVATWPLTAAARGLRETQAIELALANKTLDEATWVEKQVEEAAEFDEQDASEAVV